MDFDCAPADWTDAELAEMRDEADARVAEIEVAYAAAGDDPRVVREARRDQSITLRLAITSRRGVLDYRWGDVAGYRDASRDVHLAALAQAHALASARAARIASTRAIATATESATHSRFSTTSALAHRAIADLAGRLHGLIHTCLLAARVSTAQAIAVAAG